MRHKPGPAAIEPGDEPVERPHPVHAALTFLLKHAAIQQPEARQEAAGLQQALDENAPAAEPAEPVE